ncbi:MAG: dipeptidase [Thermoplasmata archaeon]|nr:dipeptidase [Thermoplasmata archaeon]
MPPKVPTPAQVHRSALVVDTHADTPQRFADDGFDLDDPLQGGQLNLASIHKGNLGAQFFSIWVEPTLYNGQFARRTLELIDAVKRQVADHSRHVVFVATPEGVERAHRTRKFAALMGIEGGHSIENSLALLRQYHALGVRYMTLTWSNSNDWADSSGDLDDPAVPHTKNGLTGFGERVVREMNRLGMMVDISHVSDRTFYRAVAISRAPVLASHSNARALCDHPRNMTDDMIRALANTGGPNSKGGVVQVNFFSGFLSQAYRDAWKARMPEVDAADAVAHKKAKVAGRKFTHADKEQIRRRYMDKISRPPFSALIDHIDHIAKLVGVDHVGLGSDFDGVSNQLPKGLDSAADLPKITRALMEREYSADDCRKILGANLLRVFREVEAVSKELNTAGSSGPRHRV